MVSRPAVGAGVQHATALTEVKNSVMKPKERGHWWAAALSTWLLFLQKTELELVCDVRLSVLARTFPPVQPACWPFVFLMTRRLLMEGKS